LNTTFTWEAGSLSRDRRTLGIVRLVIQRRQAMLSWLFVGALFVLCGVLGVLQYRWIGEVSLAARDRLRASLQASLDRVGRDFQTDLLVSCRSLIPANLS